MRMLSQTELSRLSRPELLALQRTIAQALPSLPAGSADLRTAHANLHNIRCALARLNPTGPRL